MQKILFDFTDWNLVREENMVIYSIGTFSHKVVDTKFYIGEIQNDSVNKKEESLLIISDSSFLSMIQFLVRRTPTLMPSIKPQRSWLRQRVQTGSRILSISRRDNPFICSYKFVASLIIHYIFVVHILAICIRMLFCISHQLQNRFI